MFLYRQFLGMELRELQFGKVSKGRRLPVVFSHGEAMAVIGRLSGHHRLAVSLMYGAGLRVMEAVRLRVRDLDFEQQCLFGARGER
ncbi:tyrosine-type recombinase/integrase [Microbulbifer halophilus]|uniref:tyrosine-type recombinase/integrase n=1 Tax=Microbulbifer halophilus TaxID=453963 RepID=UPI00361B2B25